MYMYIEQGWQSIDRPGKPGFSRAGQYSQKWQYWAIKYFPLVFITKYFKTACIVVLLL